MKTVTVSTKRLLDVTDNISANIIKTKVVLIQDSECFSGVSLKALSFLLFSSECHEGQMVSFGSILQKTQATKSS